MKAERIIQEHAPTDGREWECQCARCGSSMVWEDCTNCEDGYSGHDCGEDCCCCADPEPNVRCDICRGDGGWWGCCSGDQWCIANPLKGREAITRGMIEWFTFDKLKEVKP